MKANGAPEKIYFDGESKACKLPVFSSQNIEYTSTDAFIKKACEWLDEIYISQECLSLDDIEEFKNYMKGK